MANSSVQREVEEWVRSEYMPNKFGQSFRKCELPLTSGGKFEFDAVSKDGDLIACISTSGAKTQGGRGPAGKLNKLRADMYFLLLTSTKLRIMLFTEQDMYAALLKEKEKGRVANEIELAVVDDSLPEDLRVKLEHARRVASDEVTPKSD